MGMLATQRIGQILDRMVREKEISASFFGRAGDCLDDPDQRRWFRRMGQDEKDQRKILMKHRRELCGPRDKKAPVPVSVIHQTLEVTAKTDKPTLVDCLRLAVLAAEQMRNVCARASDATPDRSCKIFLKILSQESDVHRKELLTELRRVEREQLEEGEERAA
jgi:hypothetical protein